LAWVLQTLDEEQIDEDWQTLCSFFPRDWQEMALDTGALKGLRKNKSPEDLLRTLLIHLGCGYSLRETALRARKAEWADLSDVALMKRLRKSRDWLRLMCVALFQSRGVALSCEGTFQVRAFDATTVKEPGKTGSLWRIHYSVCLPSLACDFFRLTETKGTGTGESFKQFPIRAGDHILGDRGYSTAPGIEHVTRGGGYVIVRVNTSSLPLYQPGGGAFDLLGEVTALRRTGAINAWEVEVGGQSAAIEGRLCAIRKSQEAIKISQENIKQKASRKGRDVKPETFEYAKYVILFTTFPKGIFRADQVLQWYRTRWQVELVFKRFKSLAQIGHLPKYDDDSSKAWLYGKPFVALLIEKMADHAVSVSPWGSRLEEPSSTECLA
jgi:hypothetical protein